MAISSYNKTLLNKMNSTANKTGLGDLIDAQLPTADLVAYTSAAGSGGAATEAMTVTGLAAGDTILAVHQKTDGANNLPLLGWSTQTANALTGIWASDPGAGAVIVVLVKKA